MVFGSLLSRHVSPHSAPEHRLLLGKRLTKEGSWTTEHRICPERSLRISGPALARRKLRVRIGDQNLPLARSLENRVPQKCARQTHGDRPGGTRAHLASTHRD